MPLPEVIYVTSTNIHKAREIRNVLGRLGMEIHPANELGDLPHVEETGSTFMENAELKAIAFALHFKAWVLADDSGLEVDALDGAPGVHSARYSGPEADDQNNNQKLLMALKDVEETGRSARYRCAIAVASPQGLQFCAEGSCEGRITTEPAGRSGFGYDPYFWSLDLKQTFASVPPEEKDAVSHRGRAVQALFEKMTAGSP